MSQYLMVLTPQEPFFFGNEKTFVYPGQTDENVTKRYYVTGERTPSQTTLIGVLRYILLPNKKEYHQYTAADIAANNAVVGERSFQYGQPNVFGKIRHLSPLFLMKGDERFVTTPFDHAPGNAQYTPFSEYGKTIDGTFVYPLQYDVKNGLPQSYMRVGDGKIVEARDLFDTVTRVGINRKAKDGGFFKREYRTLKEEFSFAAYVTLDDDIAPQNTIVYLGQGKSLFTATFVPVANETDKQFEQQIRAMLRHNVVYCFSDTFVSDNVYATAHFAITDLRDYRAYTTKYGHNQNDPTYYKSIEKGSSLYKLIKAGSIFIPNCKNFTEQFDDQNVQVIGFNTLLSGTEET